jgi:hypothetical protein
MRKFIINVSLFGFICLLSVYLVFSCADGYADPYYLKFTTSKQNSLIIGNSKAAQGLNPDVMDKILHKAIYNYSFDISKSPFGPAYLNSIKRKLSKEKKDGIFIVTVDCWSIYGKDKNPNDVSSFWENSSCVGEMEDVDQNPNFQYLTKYMSGNYYKIIFKPTVAQLHENGWLEVSLDMDSSSVARRTKSTLVEYQNYLSLYQFSKVRLDYLMKTVDFLRQHGHVYLVRLPVSPQLMDIENQLSPNFSELLERPTKKSSGFLDLTSKNSMFSYTDGVHLSAKSSKLVSEEIALWIRDRERDEDLNHSKK